MPDCFFILNKAIRSPLILRSSSVVRFSLASLSVDNLDFSLSELDCKIQAVT